jgi:hypothetical protein
MLVASYLLGICERELRLSSGFCDAEVEALTKFLGKPGTRDELRHELRRNIRAGVYDGQWDALLELILAQTANSVLIVRPEHLAPEHRG